MMSAFHPKLTLDFPVLQASGRAIPPPVLSQRLNLAQRLAQPRKLHKNGRWVHELSEVKGKRAGRRAVNPRRRSCRATRAGRPNFARLYALAPDCCAIADLRSAAQYEKGRPLSGRPSNP
jgi:hypothetical protein